MNPDNTNLEEYYEYIKTCKTCKQSYGLDHPNDNGLCPICYTKEKRKNMKKESF